jgi:hypothetical protein
MRIRDIARGNIWKVTEARCLEFHHLTMCCKNFIVNFSVKYGSSVSKCSWALIVFFVLLCALPPSAEFRPMETQFDFSDLQNSPDVLKNVWEMPSGPMPMSEASLVNT